VAAVGHYRFALRPEADEAAFEQLMSGLDGEDVLQLTRVTSRFDERLLQAVRPGDGDRTTRSPRAYLWEVTVHLVGGGHRYDFAASADRVQDAVAELATLVSVETFRPMDAAT
jgi:hypothetical protein